MKIHTGIDLAGSIPEFVFLKSGTEKINGDLLIAENNITLQPDTGKVFVFVTNRFDLDAKTICDIYRARWEIEIFFKTIKQNLKIKKFLGLSEHAVKAQIYAALIAYLLIAYEKITHRSGIPMVDLMAMTMSCLILRTPLKVIMAHFKTLTHAPPPLQTAFNF